MEAAIELVDADWLSGTSSLDPPRYASYVIILSHVASWRYSSYIIEGVSLELKTKLPFSYVTCSLDIRSLLSLLFLPLSVFLVSIGF